MKIQGIDYSERSKFYDFEVGKEFIITQILEDISRKYNFKSTILCPCASGTYLKEFSDLFSKSYFFDIEKNMVDMVNNKISKNFISNVTAKIIDLNNINDCGINCDCIFLLNQGVQYLNIEQFTNFLIKSYQTSNYILLDIFDFELNGKLTYYDSEIKDDKLYLSKEFIYNHIKVQRFIKHVHEIDSIKFIYKYFINKSEKYNTSFKLYNYKIDVIKNIINNSSKYEIEEFFINENGRYIFMLKRR